MSKSNAHRAHPSVRTVRSGFARRAFLIGAAVSVGLTVLAGTWPDSTDSASAETVTVWESPTHRCCAEWISYLRRKGYHVIVNEVADVTPIKMELDIPASLYSCHTAKIGEYLIEGHVPAAAIAKLLDERPELKGIALPGMPAGPPGMGGSPGLYRVIAFTAEGEVRRFADVGI